MTRNKADAGEQDICALHVFCDVYLGAPGGDSNKIRTVGPVWHRLSRTVSWLDFSDMSPDSASKVLYVVGALMPLLSAPWSVAKATSMFGTGAFRAVTALGPMLVWGLPVVLGFVGWLLVEFASIRVCKRNGVPVTPSSEERAEYVHTTLEQMYRHNNGYGLSRGSDVPYLNLAKAFVGLVLLTGISIFLLAEPGTLGRFILMELCFTVFVFVWIVGVFMMLPRFLVLLRLERLYGKSDETGNGDGASGSRRGGKLAGTKPRGAVSGRSYVGVIPVDAKTPSDISGDDADKEVRKGDGHHVIDDWQ